MYEEDVMLQISMHTLPQAHLPVLLFKNISLFTASRLSSPIVPGTRTHPHACKPARPPAHTHTRTRTYVCTHLICLPLSLSLFHISLSSCIVCLEKEGTHSHASFSSVTPFLLTFDLDGGAAKTAAERWALCAWPAQRQSHRRPSSCPLPPPCPP